MSSGDSLDYWRSRKTLFLAPKAPDKGIAEVRNYKRFCGQVSEIDYFVEIRERGIVATERLIERTVDEKGINLILFIFFGDIYQFPLELFLRLRRRARIILWFYDDEQYFHTHSKYYAQTADAVATNDFSAVQAYRKIGVPAIFNSGVWIPREVFRPIDVPRDIDVSFLGNCRKNDRASILSFLRANNIAVQTYGPGSTGGWFAESELSKLYSRTKINLSFTKLDNLSWLNDDDPIINRVLANKAPPFQAGAARSFCLTEYAPFMEEYFEIGREVACFHDRESLLDGIRYFLSHDEEREEMARRAYEKVLACYTDDSFPRVLDDLHRVLHPVSPYLLQTPTAYIGPRFSVRQINVLFVHIIFALSRRQFSVAASLLPRLFSHGLWMFFAGSFGGLIRSIRLGLNRGRIERPVI